MDPLDPDGFSNQFRDELGGRLLDARTIVVSQPISQRIGGEITEQLAVLDAESQEPIRVVMGNAPGGDFETALSTYDFLRSVSSPVTMVGGGRISGAGVVVFVGATANRRAALPHVRFRLEEPTQREDTGSASDLVEMAEQAEELRERIVRVLVDATGQENEQVQRDLRRQRAFDAEEAREYGLVDQIVESRKASLE